MKLDRWVAVFFLLFSFLYGYGAVTYRLLPFERNMVFLPNTLPIGLAALGIILSFILLFAPKPQETEETDGDVLGTVDLRRFREYEFGRAFGLLAAMIVYALAIFPIGFVVSTTAFLIVSATVLGERRYVILVPVSLAGALIVWFLVQEVLGVFLRPWPIFLVS
ncbi:MAG: tripartite tricarboxylate transporter TctB family protein [Alphaproteobacteria bacterium]|nr:tripartite tricarboxylate transporter TctB family protein [Alphaproteobacteria bacterium]